MHSLNSNISAIMAFGRKMAVHADNVANINSNGFKKNRAILKEGPDRNVTVDIERIDPSARPVPEISKDEVVQNESSDVDLATEVTEMMITQNGYQANSAFIKNQEELIGTILDLLS